MVDCFVRNVHDKMFSIYFLFFLFEKVIDFYIIYDCKSGNSALVDSFVSFFYLLLYFPCIVSLLNYCRYFD